MRCSALTSCFRVNIVYCSIISHNNGIGDDKLIAEAFAESFAKVANEKRYSKLNDDLDIFSPYTGNVVKIDHFSVVNISKVILQMERGKSASFDKLTVEHFHHCHPCIIIMPRA